jgi:hypothetical protein
MLSEKNIKLVVSTLTVVVLLVVVILNRKVQLL